jgi:hypothetical protein
MRLDAASYIRIPGQAGSVSVLFLRLKGYSMFEQNRRCKVKAAMGLLWAMTFTYSPALMAQAEYP